MDLLLETSLLAAVLGLLGGILALDWVARGRRIWLRGRLFLGLAAALGGAIGYLSVTELSLGEYGAYLVPPLAAWSYCALILWAIPVWTSNIRLARSIDRLFSRAVFSCLIGAGVSHLMAMFAGLPHGAIFYLIAPVLCGGLHRGFLTLRLARMSKVRRSRVLEELEQFQLALSPWVADAIEMEGPGDGPRVNVLPHPIGLGTRLKRIGKAVPRLGKKEDES